MKKVFSCSCLRSQNFIQWNLWILYEKNHHSCHLMFSCIKIDTIPSIKCRVNNGRQLKAWKCWGKGSGGMRFHSSAPLCEKYGEAVFNWDWLSNVTIIDECQQVFNHHSTKASCYNCAHPDSLAQPSKLPRMMIWWKNREKHHVIMRLCSVFLLLLLLLIGWCTYADALHLQIFDLYPSVLDLHELTLELRSLCTLL